MENAAEIIQPKHPPTPPLSLNHNPQRHIQALPNTSEDGDSTTSLGNLFQCLTTLNAKYLIHYLFNYLILYLIRISPVSSQGRFLWSSHCRLSRPAAHPHLLSGTLEKGERNTARKPPRQYPATKSALRTRST